MQRMQAFKFELMPNGQQQRDMRRFAGACRFVYNKAIATQKERHAAGLKYASHFDMCKWLPEWKKEIPWLKESPSHTLQKALKDVDRAYKNFFEGRASFPCFKRKGMSESFQEFDSKCFKVDSANSRIQFPKLGWVRYRNSRDILGVAKSITVSHTNGKWFASIQTERETPQPVPTATSAIGIDMGIARFASMSDGTYIAPVSSFKAHEDRLRRYQRAMSRKKKFSKNWHKAKRRVQKIQTRIANVRKDFLHKATSTISKNHAMIAIEDLQVSNMSKSAKGTKAAPGKNVAAKSGLNKAILDQGWFEFRRQLEYKTAWNGGILVAVPAHHTSQTCPACGHVSPDNRKTQAHFACVDCGHEDNADTVGAINVLARGHRVLACGEPVRRAKVAKPRRAGPTKQEPTEATQQEVTHA